MRTITAIMCSIALAGCPKDTETLDTGVEPTPIAPAFYRYLQGSFDSADQAAEDASYYHIDLTMCAVEAPELGELALYVEQAVPGSDPYRQRIYVIEEAEPVDSTARSVIYELDYTMPWIGFCEGEGSATGTVTPDMVTELEGCAVTVSWDGASFEGSTVEGECLTDWQGATYATSEVMLDAERLESWDRGWDANGDYVWGATAGPYVFVRRSALATE
jgi:CpeT protein